MTCIEVVVSHDLKQDFVPDTVKRLLKVSEIVDQVFLVKQVFFSDQSYIEDLLSGASPGPKSCLFFSQYFDSQHDLAWVTDEAVLYCIVA